MLTFHLIPVFLWCSKALGGPISTNDMVLAPSPEVVPVTFFGNIAAVQVPGASADTRIYYQNPDNSIQVMGVSGPFTTGRRFLSLLVVPAAEVQFNTLIAAVATRFNGGDFAEVHLFFISPSNVLSEYIGDSTGFRGGPTCTDCITALNFVVQSGNRVLYATGSSDPGSPALLRVGFISAGAPDTLTEVDYDVKTGWRIAVLS